VLLALRADSETSIQAMLQSRTPGLKLLAVRTGRQLARMLQYLAFLLSLDLSRAKNEINSVLAADTETNALVFFFERTFL